MLSRMLHHKGLFLALVMAAIAMASPGAEMSQPQEPEVHVFYHDVPISRSSLPANSHYQVGDRIVPELQVTGAAEVYHHAPGTHNVPMPYGQQMYISDIPQLAYGDNRGQQRICGPQDCLPAPPSHAMERLRQSPAPPGYPDRRSMSGSPMRGRGSPSAMHRGRISPGRGDTPHGQYMPRGPPMLRPGMDTYQGSPTSLRGRGGSRGRMSPLGRGMPMRQGIPMRPHLSPGPRIHEIEEDHMTPGPSHRSSSLPSPAHSSRQAYRPVTEGVQQAPPLRRPRSKASSRASSRAPSIHEDDI